MCRERNVSTVCKKQLNFVNTTKTTALEKGKVLFLDIIQEKCEGSDMNETKMYKSYYLIPPNHRNICKIFLHPLNISRAARPHRLGGIHMSEYSIKIWERIFGRKKSLKGQGTAACDRIQSDTFRKDPFAMT